MGEDFIKLAADCALARRVTPAFDVGGILKQRKHAFFAVFGEGVEVEELVVGGRGVHFEIAGVNDYAEGAMDGERHAIDQAVRDLDRMDCEGAQFNALVGAHFAQVRVVKKTVFVKLVLDVGERELGAPDGNLEFREYPGQGTDVIFMAVGENNSANALAIFDEIGNIRDNDVDT